MNEGERGRKKRPPRVVSRGHEKLAFFCRPRVHMTVCTYCQELIQMAVFVPALNITAAPLAHCLGLS